MLDRLKGFARSILGRNRLHQEMDAEMRFHIEQYRQDLIRQGTSPEDAAWKARRAFGNLSRTQEDCREAKGLPMFNELIRNTVYALRQLRRSPGFAAAVILTLGLCIGVNTAVFSVIDAVMLRGAPYPQPDRLFDVVREFTRGPEVASYAGQDGHAWEALKDSRTVQVAALGGTTGVNLNAGNRAFYVKQQRVSVRYFSVMGLPLAQGREFEAAEDRAGGPDAVVLSYRAWKRFFNGDRAVLGRAILLRGAPHLVVGVAKTYRAAEERFVDLDGGGRQVTEMYRQGL